MVPAEGRHSLVRAETRQLLTLAGPVVLARLGVMTMGLMDAVVVGRYSAEQLGFHALAWAPTSVVLTMAIGLPSGAAFRVGQTVQAKYGPDWVSGRVTRVIQMRPGAPLEYEVRLATVSAGSCRPA